MLQAAHCLWRCPHNADRAADSTDVCRSVVSDICEEIDWFESSSDMGGGYAEGLFVHNVNIVHIGFVKIR